MARVTPLHVTLYFFTLFLIFGFGADYVIGATQVGMGLLSIISLVCTVFAACDVWDNRKG